MVLNGNVGLLGPDGLAFQVLRVPYAPGLTVPRLAKTRVFTTTQPNLKGEEACWGEAGASGPDGRIRSRVFSCC